MNSLEDVYLAKKNSQTEAATDPDPRKQTQSPRSNDGTGEGEP